MRVGLIDVDSHHFPNLALMKISAHHKARGDDVQWAIPLEHYDVVYQSKVFDDTYSPDIDWQPNADRIVKGGTGYGLDNKLPDEIEHIYPDYSIYPELTEDTAYGFLTRGCPRHCDFCIVGDKEGLRSVKVADLSEFWRGQKYINSLQRWWRKMIKAEIDSVNKTCHLDIRGKLGDVSCETQYLVGSLASSIEDADMRYVFLKDMLAFIVKKMKDIEKNA